MIEDPFDPPLKPYLRYSAFTHIGIAGLIIWNLNRPSGPSQQVYKIDFIGPSAGIMNRELEAAAATQKAKSAARVTPMTHGDEFAQKPKHHRTVLPRPSILNDSSSSTEEKEEKPSGSDTKAEAAAAPTGRSGQGAAVSADIDMPNFPYPWYITQVRTALWNQWSSNIPSDSGETLISFSIMHEGKVVDLRVESSSGDRAFDRTALNAVQAAMPFPPLPRDFPDSFLNVHVKFQTQQ